MAADNQARPVRQAVRPARKYGVPRWRVGKPDGVLALAEPAARHALLSIATTAQVGEHLGVKSEGERVATHLFTALLPGYGGWQWFATLARAPRARTATVCEVGMVPTEESVLAPEWVPWSKRVLPEDQHQEEPAGQSRESAGEPAVAASQSGTTADDGKMAENTAGRLGAGSTGSAGTGDSTSSSAEDAGNAAAGADGKNAATGDDDTPADGNSARQLSTAQPQTVETAETGEQDMTPGAAEEPRRPARRWRGRNRKASQN